VEDEGQKRYQIKSEGDSKKNECWTLICKGAGFKHREMENEWLPGLT